MTDPITPRQKALRRISALETERSAQMSNWRDINSVLMPITSQYFSTATGSQTANRNAQILDSTATYAIGTLAAGMQSGMTSPARPWLKNETEDTDLMNVKAVSTWCDLVTQKMRTIFSRSNTYKALHGLYGELGAYGTMANVLLPDFKNVIHHYPLTAGEFCISADDRGEVNTLSRTYQMTVEQIVTKYVRRPSGAFEWERVSPAVKNAWDRHNLDQWIPVFHLIQPRKDRDTLKVDARNMPFESICLEAGGTDHDRQLMSESGYKRFPVLVARWETQGTGVYGSKWPGIVALGDILQLQHEQLRKAQVIDYQTKPPLQVPVSLKNQDNDFLPGGVTYVDQVGPQNAVRTAFDVMLRLDHLLPDIQDVRQRIDRAFFADLFLFLSSIRGIKGQMTAREVAEIHEEKLLMLGPVVENIENELLQPMVDITFDAMLEAGILPPPPPELSGQNINTEFIGLLSQAQRQVSMGGVDRLIGAVASIAAAKQDPSVWDKIDTDKAVDKAANYLGVDPEIIRGDDEVAALREQRAQAMQRQAQAEAAAQAAETAKSLAGADMSTDNALTNLTRGFAAGALQ
jgi:hypothetical protein